MKVVKGDNVLVIAGDDKGKTGTILKVFPEKGRIVVEGVNFVKRHTRPSQKNQKGGVLEKEASISASNVLVIDPKTGKPTRIRYQRLANGKRVRVAATTGEMLET